jgi:hypothetical protein
MEFVRVDEFDPNYREAIEKLNVQIALANVERNNTPSNSRRKLRTKRLEALVKTREQLIKHAKAALKNKKADDKKFAAEEKKKVDALKEETNVEVGKVRKAGEEVVRLEKALKEAKTPEEKSKIKEELKVAKEKRSKAVKDYTAYAKRRASGKTKASEPVISPKEKGPNVSNKVSATQTPVVTSTDTPKAAVKNSVSSTKVSKGQEPIKVVPGTTKVLTDAAAVAGYIIRMSESRNNYGIANVVHKETFVSFGAYQFTEKSGSLLKVLKVLSGFGPSYKPQLDAIISKFNRSGYFSGTNSELITFLKQIGNDILCKKAQDTVFKNKYYIPAEKQYKKLGVNNKLLLVHIVDHYHNRGTVRSFLQLYSANHDIIGSRIADYRSLKKWSTYGKGWTNRVKHTDAMARQFISGKDIPASDGGTNNTEVTPENKNKPTKTGGVKAGIAMAIKGLLSFFGIGEDNKPDVPGNSSARHGFEANKFSSKLSHNDASKVNPLIFDWKTEKRYNSLNDAAKTFYSKFSHYAYANGYKLQIPKLGGNRSKENQQKLYDQGRKGNPGKIVTWTLKSQHIGGGAIDIISLNGYKDVKGNLTIAKMMRAFAEENPELGAQFLKISKDPNHVQFPKSTKITPVDVESEIDGSKGDNKAVEEKYAKLSKDNKVHETYGLPSKAGGVGANKFTRTVDGGDATYLRSKSNKATKQNTLETPGVKQSEITPKTKQKTAKPTEQVIKVENADEFSEARLTVLQELRDEIKKMNAISEQQLTVSKDTLDVTVKKSETKTVKARPEVIPHREPVIRTTR